jgi:NADH:ubiquinone oxidoreductase subunit 3 (subunit A)
MEHLEHWAVLLFWWTVACCALVFIVASVQYLIDRRANQQAAAATERARLDRLARFQFRIEKYESAAPPRAAGHPSRKVQP